MNLFTRIVSYLPASIQPYAKAFLPFIGTLIAIGVQYAVTGEYDRAEFVTTITGFGSTLVTFLFPNIPPGPVKP